jgi:TusA-related sulfurtransferase
MDPVELNCLGLKCPRPIIEIAKLARKSPPDTVVKIISDDLAFESDIKAWCETTGATLLEISKENGAVKATVKLTRKA